MRVVTAAGHCDCSAWFIVEIWKGILSSVFSSENVFEGMSFVCMYKHYYLKTECVHQLFSFKSKTKTFFNDVM